MWSFSALWLKCGWCDFRKHVIFEFPKVIIDLKLTDTDLITTSLNNVNSTVQNLNLKIVFLAASHNNYEENLQTKWIEIHQLQT